MRNVLSIVLLLGLMSAANLNAQAPLPLRHSECAVLLHGLLRSDLSMGKIADALYVAGYHVENVDYPSRDSEVAELAMENIPPALARCRERGAGKIHFVTHSMGGILIRYFLQQQPIPDLGRVVMIAPPNQGSELVDTLGGVPGFDWINGPAGAQLGTGSDSLPNQLGAVDFEVGVIAGNRSWNPVYSNLIPGDDDGKVSVERAKVEGMRDFIVLPATHTFIMRDLEAIRQTIYFLQKGVFSRDSESLAV